MKTLFCCGIATHTGQGQAGLWRWWYYYRPYKNLLQATHFAVNNDGNTNLPNERFVRLLDGSNPIPSFAQDQLNLVYWPYSLPRVNQWTCPGYYRSLSTMARCAREQGFDKLIYCEWDFMIINAALMDEIVQIDHGLVAYWVPRYLFAESNLIICGKDHFSVLEEAAMANSAKSLTTETIAENSFPWTEIRKHCVGDRYPEFTTSIPMTALYCAQLPVDMAIVGSSIMQLASSLCAVCGGKIRFNLKGLQSCEECHPEEFVELDPFELKP